MSDMQDPGLYDFWPYRDRPRIVWPGGKKLALWIAPNIEFYELDPPTNPSRKPWARPNPDVLAYSARDFGNRVGHWRLMEAMDEFNLRGSVSLSAAMVDHHPEIISSCIERKWEFFSHGIYNTRYTYGMSEAQERAMIVDSVQTIEAATGEKVRGYLAPALTHTERTLEIIASEGFWYSCDLFQDDQPQPLRTTAGRLISMPYSLEVNDVIGYGVYTQSPRAYADVLKRQFDQLLLEGETSGTVMCVPLHAYLVGHAHRMPPFREALRHMAAHADDVWYATAAEIAGFFREQYYDATLRDIARHKTSQGEPQP
jgi:peptidoglycan/xylan/chitin deacetylase (PgdA/CDA1 family)